MRVDERPDRATSASPNGVTSPKSRNVTRPPGLEEVVARVRIAVEEVQPVEAAEHEAEDRLAGEVALRLGPRLGLGEAHALGELGGEHALRRVARRAPPGMWMNGWPA